jgi:hypothetical protein
MSDDPLDRLGALAMAMEALFARFEGHYNSLHAEAAELRTDVLAELGKTRSDIMGKVAELQDGITGMRDDLTVTLARWFTQTQAWIRDDDPYRRTLHRVTGWRPATEEQTAEANEQQQSVAAVVNPTLEETAPQGVQPAKTATRIVKAKKPRPRR